MAMTVIFCDEFDVEFQAMPTERQDELLADKGEKYAQDA